MKKRQLIALISAVTLILAPLTVLAMTKNVRGPNRPPMAKAGPDRVVEPHQMLVLNGSESYDPDGDVITYRWELVARPRGGQAELKDNLGMTTCRLSPDVAGVWMISLTVSDGKLTSEGDVMQVRVQQPTPPPTKPDLEVAEVRVLAKTEAGTKYIKKISVKMKNKGLDYTGPLEFRVFGLDQFPGGHFTLDERVTIDPLCLTQDDEGWFTLLRRDIEWSADVATITFRVIADPAQRIDETNEQNNAVEKTFDRDTVPDAGREPPLANRPDFVITDIDASGLYRESKIGAISVQIENRGLDYAGYLDFRVVVTHKGQQVFRDNSATVDTVCLRRSEKKWVRLVRREVEWPEDAASYNFLAEVDPHRHIDELNEHNNRYSRSIFRGALVSPCNVDVAKTISVRDSRARMFALKEGERFIFDCSGSNKFDFFITLQNYCHANNTVELYIVYDWTPLRADGKNKILKKKYRVDFFTTGDRRVQIDNLKIPKKKRFKNQYTTFAIIARHDKGYDVIFSAPVRISGVR